MKLSTNRRHVHGIFLIQGLVYMVILSIISYVAFNAFFSLKTGVKRVQLVADDIVTTMEIGEQWRADIRLASEAVTIKQTDHSHSLFIPLDNGKTIFWHFSQEKVVRTDAFGHATSILENVAETRFIPDKRKHVSAWRWELELKPNGPNARTRPLFTFMAVTGTITQ